jgi:hypothetical protein
MDACRRDFPDLLSRVDRELAPWAEGISRDQVDNLWRCPGDDSRRRFVGFFASIRGGQLAVEQARNRPMKRTMHLTMILQSVAESFELPDVDFAMLTADHPEQGFSAAGNIPVDAHFNQSRAPLLLAYRKQRDNGTVAAPDWTFWSTKAGSEHYAPVLPAIDDAASLIRAGAARHPWADRAPKLFFMGANARGDERTKAWQLARDAPGWGWIGISNAQAAGSAKYGVGLVGSRPDLFFNETTLPEHCAYKYLLNLAGNAASSRFKVHRPRVAFLKSRCTQVLKRVRFADVVFRMLCVRAQYLFFCGSVVVSPVRSGGNGGAAAGNEYEEYWSHRAEPGVHFVAPPAVANLPAAVSELRANDAHARAVGLAGAAWAASELTKRAAWCYWAALLHKLAELQRRGGALGPRPPEDTLGTLRFGGPQPSRNAGAFCEP